MNKVMPGNESEVHREILQPAKRPRSVTLLAILVLTLAVLHLTRFEQSLSRWAFLQESLPFHPAYLAVNGAIWGFAGLVLGWAIWVAKSWAPQSLRIVALLYTISYWLERLLLAGNPLRNINWPFIAILNLLVVGFIFWQFQRKPVKQYFGEMHDK